MYNLKKFKNDICLLENNQSLTYNQLDKFCKKIITKTVDAKLNFVLIDYSMTGCKLLIANLQSNSTIMLIDPEIKKKNLALLINKFQPNYIYIPKKNNHLKEYKLLYSIENYNIYRYRVQTKTFNSKIKILLSTSGSTGKPKFVALSKKNILSNGLSIQKYLIGNKKKIFINNLPLFYSYGLSILNSSLISGSKFILTDYKIIDNKFWKIFNLHKVSHFSGVPFTYKILKKINFFSKICKNLKNLCIAGGPINYDDLNYLYRKCKKKNIKIFNMYGQTEASPRMTFHEIKKKDKNFLSVGKAIHLGRISLIDDEGNLITQKNKIGKIIYEGPNIFGGYVSKLNDFKNINFKKKILYTGDYGYKNEDDKLFLVGRNDQILKIFGIRHDPKLLSEVFKNLKVQYCYICKDNCLFIFYVNNRDISSKIIYAVYNKLKVNKNYINIIKLDKFPINANNKIDYESLYKRIAKKN